MEELSTDDKKTAYRLLIFLFGCVGMYFWVSGGIDRCGSFEDTGCMMADLFDALTFLSLFLMIVIGIIGWFWASLGILALVGFIIYTKLF